MAIAMVMVTVVNNMMMTGMVMVMVITSSMVVMVSLEAVDHDPGDDPGDGDHVRHGGDGVVGGSVIMILVMILVMVIM